jgi:hypothetical protein
VNTADHHEGSICRICTFQNEPQPEARAMKCECCGVLMGVEDQRPDDIALWRAKFISKGGRWQNKAFHQPPGHPASK